RSRHFGIFLLKNWQKPESWLFFRRVISFVQGALHVGLMALVIMML
ncbi:hypothetical protein APX70_02609, partial [Pseudomonas syringae pv. maculicola]